LRWRVEAGIWQTVAEWVVVAVGSLLSFSVISYVGPNVRRRWKWLTPGSVLGTVGLLASSVILRAYVHQFGNYSKTYGSLAGVTLLSFWFWIAAVVLLIAFQFDRIVENEREKR
jgi:membrane protein